jgi:hypothetical protein
MSTPRFLRAEEAELIRAMVGTSPKSNELLSVLPECLVQEMQDGRMGSLRFMALESHHQRFGEKIAEAEFLDADGVLVSATINLDNRGELFELDLWKVDFSPLKRYPKPGDIKIIRSRSAVRSRPNAR